MKGIGHECEGVGEEAGDDLEEEEGGINGDHDLDARGFGPRDLEADHDGMKATATQRQWRRLLHYDVMEVA